MEKLSNPQKTGNAAENRTRQHVFIHGDTDRNRNNPDRLGGKECEKTRHGLQKIGQ